jgi:hypothetical protein
MTLLSNEEVVKFTEAQTKDGTILDSPTFDIGETIDVVAEDGTKTPAPDGEHEIALKDSEGKEVIIRVQVKDGKIESRENVEEANPEVGLEEVKEEVVDKTPAIEEQLADVIDGLTPAEVSPEVAKSIAEKVLEVIHEREEMKKQAMADATTEEAKGLPNTTEEAPSNEVKSGEDSEDPIIKMSYRIDEMEKLVADIKEKLESAYPEEGQEVSSLDPTEMEEELPKLNGAPLETKFSAETVKNNFGKKTGDYQSSVLSKMYK